MTAQCVRAERKHQTSASDAAACPLTGDRRGHRSDGCRRRALPLTAEAERRVVGRTNRFEREHNGTTSVRPCGGEEINRCDGWCIRAGHVEEKFIRGNLQRRAAAERRHNRHARARRFIGGGYGNGQQARHDADKETSHAGDRHRTGRRVGLLDLERRHAVRLLRTIDTVARQDALL